MQKKKKKTGGEREKQEARKSDESKKSSPFVSSSYPRVAAVSEGLSALRPELLRRLHRGVLWRGT